MAQARPRIKIQPEKPDKVLSIAGYCLLLALWAMVLLNYSHLPETIPTHFNAAGQADNYGSKMSLFVLPVVASILFVALTILARYPHIFNYPVTITEENAGRHYRTAIRMLNMIKTATIVLLSFTTFSIISIANGRGEGLGAWFLPLELGLLFIPVTFFIVKMFRHP